MPDGLDAAAAAAGGPPAAVRVVQVELARGVGPVWTGGRYAAVQALVRHRGTPVGWVRVPCDGRVELSADVVREAVERQLGPRLPALVYGPAGQAPPTPPSDELPPITVVVCTRDRPELLDACLTALAAIDYPDYEVLVVDNGAPGAGAAQRAVRRGARYVREVRPGLDWARNRGLAAAQHDLVAFTDDDARPDPGWLRALGAAFADPTVMAVTGPVAPLELETPAQEYRAHVLDDRARGFVRRRLRRAELSDAELLAARDFGAGANMAFRRSVFDDVRPFDPALDAGTASAGGGDLELLHRLVARGHTLVYEPAALVWRLHARDASTLRRRISDDACGFASYLYTCWRNHTVTRSAIARFYLGWVVSSVLRRLVRPGRHRRGLVLRELAGVALSPFRYRAARHRARRVAGMPRGARGTPARIPAIDDAGAPSSLPAELGHRRDASVADLAPAADGARGDGGRGDGGRAAEPRTPDSRAPLGEATP